MHKILITVDGSENSLRAVQHAIKWVAGSKDGAELHILNVQPAITFSGVRKFISQDAIDAYYQEEGEVQLRAARALLESAGVPFTLHIGVGQVAETIAAYAKQHHCEQIVMGTRGHGAMSGMLLGSVSNKVIHHSDVPVTLVK